MCRALRFQSVYAATNTKLSGMEPKNMRTSQLLLLIAAMLFLAAALAISSPVGLGWLGAFAAALALLVERAVNG